MVVEKSGDHQMVGKIRNEEVLRRDDEERIILKTIKNKNGSWLGHILKRDCFQRRIMEG